jgi:putative methyltransferase (TIGR04325 family)
MIFIPSRKDVWAGSFESYTDAQKSIKKDFCDTVSPFENISWLKRHEKNTKFQNAPTSMRRTTLPIFACGLNISRILDYGGGSGWGYNSCVNSGLSVEEYSIVEKSSVVNYFSKKASPPVRYYTNSHHSLGQENKSPDIVYSNSTLQYLPNNFEFLNLIRQTLPKYVLLDEVLWTIGRKDWFSIQVNSDSPVVSRFISLDNLLIELQNEGYELVFKDVYHNSSAFPKMSLIPLERRISNSLTLAFSRNKFKSTMLNQENQN